MNERRSGGENSEKLAAARILAKDVLDSFTAMREYLREVGAISVNGTCHCWKWTIESTIGRLEEK